MKRTLMTILFALTLRTLLAYPITPQTLRKLIERSPLIVIAQVDNPPPKKKKIREYLDEKTNDTIVVYSYGGEREVILNIKEVLKGKPNRDGPVTVKYNPGMICPAPPYYPDKGIVIAFLAKEDTSATYFTVGLSYGTKVVEDELEMNIFRARILEYIDVVKLKKKKDRERATIEWLVRCAEEKCTRWDGAYELSRRGDFMSYYDYSKDKGYVKKLSPSQKHRLDSVFFNTDTIGYSELCLANLISKENNPKLKKHLINSLHYSEYYVTEDIMKKVMEIAPNPDLEKIVEEMDKLSYDDDKDKEVKQKQLIDRFIIAAG